MAIILSVAPPTIKIFWSCIGLYADVIKICSPSKKLQSVAEEIARFCRKPPETVEQEWTRGMKDATSLADYEKCTMALDKVQSHETWKQEKYSIEGEYDPDLIQNHADMLQKAMASSDLSALQYQLRTGLSRDLGAMNSLRLYKHSWFGTKFLIDDYINTVLEAIEAFADLTIRYNLPNAEVRFYQQSLEDSLKFFGRSALTLSGGALLGMKHIGVVKTLWEAELLPEVISGASAGSIVAAIVGTSTDEHMYEVLERFPYSDLAVFDPPGTTSMGWLSQRVRTFLWSGAFFEMENIKRVMKTWLGAITFREAHYKTGRTLNICVSSAGSAEPRLLNYVTAPDVFVWSAVCASCAVPSVFAPVNIYEKDPITKKEKLWMQNAQQMFVDGSLDHDIPMRKLEELFNVNFFIVSQVNPHVRSFLEPEEEFHGTQPRSAAPSRTWLQGAKALLREEVIHRSQQMADIGLARRSIRWVSVINQQYTGDINIYPEIRTREYFHMMMNPTPEFMIEATRAGEVATWPRMCRIKNCVAIELALQQAIHRLRDRVNFGPEARAAREARPRRSLSRGRAGRGRSARPSFLRRRSLSIESPTQEDEAMLPMRPLRVRRNASMGSIVLKPMTSALTGGRSRPLLSPQAGVASDLLGDALVMTAVTPTDRKTVTISNGLE
ncbi:uncharacterized protein A1O9_01015 [Exophiala aquamarina CBS 119918]|uniref:PNPLA domain-containing protein n=1 Tax=Exophiala aquamarina CBS 119918 TaxID=1182545 RepID=A0A072PSF0_9EURO|nr:uncharacterized protein A1O9_01015 [Exophiala aquamarina CBS 119918]KEF63039.1 hypothetical protein A1O9_01015 [Exophiala aquamarina CBS 119918]